MSWLPPPRPITAPPSYDPSDSDEMTRWKILFDWAHDDDLKNFVLGGKTFWDFYDSTGQLNTDTLIAFYFMGLNPTPAELVDFVTKYRALASSMDPGDPGQAITLPDVSGTVMVPTHLPAVWQQTWTALDNVIAQVASKRAKTGSLPVNTFLDGSGNLSDPIVINYYDDVWLKRISYPLSTVSQASSGPQWWNAGAGQSMPSIEVWATNSTDLLGNRSWARAGDPNAGWYPEGWDVAKGSGAFFDIIHAIVSVLALVLSATGIGAVVSAFVIAALSIVTDLLQAAEDEISGGNPAGALLNIGQAILSVGAAELGALSKSSPALAKLGKVGLQELGTLLKQVGTNLTPNHTTLNLQDSLSALVQGASGYSVMTKDHFDAVLAIVSGNGSVAVPLAQNGWDVAQYATASDVIGIGKIYEQSFPGPAAALWKMGAQLGTLARAQANLGMNGAITMSSIYHAGQGPVLRFNPQTDLMNYVRTVLVPRYNLSP